MEIPLKHLEEYSRLTDQDFALAHMVLEYKEYAEFFREQRKQGRRVVLDNSMHERETQALTVPEVIQAAKLINPSCVIAPDKLGDAGFTHDNFHALRKDPQCRWDPGLVLQGMDRTSRISLFTNCVSFTNTLLLPYRENRVAWMEELIEAIPRYVKWPEHLHLLGIQKNMRDLVWFSRYTRSLLWPPHKVAVDTGKPIKWALKGKYMHELDDLSGGGLLDHQTKLTPEQQVIALYNIAYMRTFTEA